MTLRIGSLFSGYGGLEIAVRNVLGGEVAWFSEYEPPTTKTPKPTQAAARVLAYRYPDVPNLGDITAVDWSQVAPVDVLAGGFPCTDISAAGRGAGMHGGTKSGLWSHMVRAIAEIQPSVVIIENVRRLLSGGDLVHERPNRCICGWIDRRGGVHTYPREEGLLLHESGGGHDGASPANSETPASTVGGGFEPKQGSNGSVVDSVLVGSAGTSGVSPAERDFARSADQVGAGSPRYPTGGDQGIAIQASEWLHGVDGSRQVALQANSPTDQGVELEGAGEDGGGNPGWMQSDCPACGRDLGDRSDGTVLRSWMGTVLGDLAELGYDAQWCGLRASDVGAPHARYRVVILARPAADPDGVGSTWPGAARNRWCGSPHHDLAPSDPGKAGRHSGVRLGRSAGQAAQRDDSSTQPSADIATHSEGDGRDERWTEPARLVGGPDVALGGDGTIADAGGIGCESRSSDDARGRDSAVWRETSENAQDGSELLDWGPYGPAIQRWERILGRSAPAPTKPGKRGGRRLNPVFVEWMMGLPEGWVTDVPGLADSEMLGRLGNGVVPRQIEAALRFMLVEMGWTS